MQVRAWAVGLAACTITLTACLPEGGPGIGERWHEGRGIVALSLPTSGPPTDLVVFGRRYHQQLEGEFPFEVDLTRFYALDRPGGAPRLLIDSVPFFSGHLWDALHRLWFVKVNQRGNQELVRVDVATGNASLLGPGHGFATSPDGSTILVMGEKIEVHDVTGRVLRIEGQLGQNAFLASSLFFVNREGLQRLALPALAPPQMLAARVRRFSPVPGQEALPLLLVEASESENRPSTSIPRQIGILRAGDPNPAPTWLAQGHFAAPATLTAEGDRIGLLEYPSPPNATPGGTFPDAIRIRVIGLQSGEEQAISFTVPPLRPRGADPFVQPPGVALFGLGAVFRPGTSELWIFQMGRLIAIFAQGQVRAIDAVDRYAHESYDSVISWRSVFTSDGRHWVFRDVTGRSHVGNADAPEAPAVVELGDRDRTDQNEFAEYDGARRLVFLSGTGQRSDLHLIDLAAGQKTTVATNVGQIERGHARLLAIVDGTSGDSGPGRLVSIDLMSGALTRLADNVTQFRLSPVCATCDPTGPGVGIAYVVQARFPFKHDGLWRATLP
jgi:hypothetical protein